MKHRIFLPVLLVALVVSTPALIFHDSRVLFWVGTAVLTVIGILTTTFVIVYYRRDWRANPFGRALMYSQISTALIVDLSIATSFLGPDWEWRYAVRLLCFVGIMVAQSRFLQLLFSLRNSEAREAYNESHDNAGRVI
jgi:hypothetical protein